MSRLGPLSCVYGSYPLVYDHSNHSHIYWCILQDLKLAILLNSLSYMIAHFVYRTTVVAMQPSS